MKKILFLLSLTFFINLTFAQDISGAKPILSSGGNHINPGYTFVLGCNVESETVTASYVDDLGDTSSYRVEVLPYQTKGYLPTAGTTVIAPDAYAAAGEIIGNNVSSPDDVWSGVHSLNTNTPFNFCFFGESKNDFIYSTNGILSFDTSYAGEFSSYKLTQMGRIAPNANCFDPDPSLLYDDNKDSILLLEDTDPTNGDANWESYYYWLKTGGYDVIEDVHEQYVIMGVHHMPMFYCGADYGYATYQMVFYETTNIIEFNIKSKPLCILPNGLWENGQQAFGLQNADRTVGIEVPSLDNAGTLNTYVQIIDPDDAYSASHINPNATFVENKKTVRFIPDGGLASNRPTFGWYINWNNVTHSGTLITNNTALTVDKGSIPIDANGDPIPVTYTAVVHYTNTCFNDVYSINTVTFTLDNPIQMHLQEQNSPDDTIEFYLEENIELCPEEDYTLTAIVQDAEPSRPFKLEWTVESFGNPVASVQIDNPVTSDANGDVNVDLFIDHTLADTLTPGVNYTYTCTLTDGTCVFSDTVNILVLDNADFAYSKTDFCASDVDPAPVPTSIYPALATPPDPYDPDYYFTIDNGGVWLHPETNATVSLDGVPDLSACFANAVTLNADGSASFTITYHGGCVDNTKEVTITITDAPIVLNPENGDPTATPPIEPSPLITQCETNVASHSAEFDLPAIDDYIANGSTGLQFDWIDLGSAVVIDDTNNTYTSATRHVQVTVTNPSAPASCPVELDFWLRVVQKPTIGTPVINLKQCDNNLPAGTAAFSGTSIESVILGGLDPALYTVHYTAVDVNGDAVTQIYVGGTPQAFESPLPATFNVESVTVTAYITLNTDVLEGCPSDEVTFDLVVKETPIVTVPSTTATPAAILTLCETDIANHAANFDTTDWNTIVLSGNSTPINPDFKVEYDYTQVDGTVITGANTMPNPFPSKSQTITVRAINSPAGTDSCPSQPLTFDIVVIETPNIIELQNTATTPLILCEDDTNANPSIHAATFDTTNWDDFILHRPTEQNDAAYDVEYIYIDIDGNTVTTTTLPANLELTSQSIDSKVIYQIDATTTCDSGVKTFDVTVIDTPIVADVPTTGITLCETDPISHTAEFDTTLWQSTILGSQPAANYYITYTAVEVADDGTETPYALPNPLTPNITVPDLKITVTVSYDITAGANSTCTSSSMNFNLEVIEKPVATPLVNTVNDPPQSTDIALILCETDTTNHTAEFDTTNWNTTILGSDQTTGYNVEYRAVKVDPITLVETPYPLPVPFPEAVNISTLPSLKIYIKVFYDIDATTRCESDEEFFFIETNPSPTISVPTDAGFPIANATLELCEDDTDADPNVHMATFDTSTWINTILNGQAGTNYHVDLTAVDLNGDTVTLPDPLPVNFETESIIITAQVTDENLPCDSVEMDFKLDVKVIPINNDIPDITQCEDDPMAHTADFDTSNWTATVIDTQDPTNLVVEYTYLDGGVTTTVVDTGVAGTTTLPPTITSVTQTVSVVIKNVTNTISCANPTPETFELRVIETPNITQLADSVTPFVALTICEDDTDTNPNVHTAAFDTTNWDDYILNRPTEQNDAAYDVEYTYVDTDGNTQTVNSSSLPNPFILSSQTIKATVRYKIDDTTYCESDEMSFDVNVRLIPFINQLVELVDDMDPTIKLIDLQICEDDSDSETAAFDTSHWNETILVDNYDNTVTPPTINPDYIIEYTYVDINGTSQTVTSTALPNPFVLTSQTIKYTVKNITLNEDTCPSEEKQFDVIVDLLPVGTDGTAVVCSGSTAYITIDNPAATPPTYKPFTFDDFATFTDVNGNENRNTYKWKAIADYPNVITGESLSYVDNGDNTNPSITDTLINTTQVVQYITYQVIPISEYGCEGLPFEIIVQVDVAPNMTDQSTVICNEEQVNFDFNLYTSLTGNSYIWHAIENNNVEGETTSDMETSTIEDTIINISGVAQIVEYVVIPKSVGGCEGTPFSVFVTVNPRPDFILKPQYFICPEDGSVMIGEDSNPNTYTYYWFEANDINTEIDLSHPKQLKVTEDMLTTSNGNYVLTVEDNFTHCTYSQFTTVSMAEQMAIASIHVSDFNTPDNTITIAMVGGTGAYEYTLHYTDSNGISQSITQNSPIFENLDANTYQIEVTDLNDCSVTVFSNDVYVLDYPPFFTPNGDGENDTWSIIGANIIPNSKIYIFDRFGKVLAKVNPNSVLGWDGTYNSVPVPEDDYWFTTEYVDPNTGKTKTVKGHFSIVREK